MCSNDHIAEAAVHSQDRGCFVQTMRKSETMDVHLLLWSPRTTGQLACENPATQKFS